MAGTLLNFVEVNLSSYEMTINTLDAFKYDVRELRKTHSASLNFYSKNGKIYYWPKAESDLPDLGGTVELVNKLDQPQLFSKVIENAVVQLFEELKNATGKQVYRVYRKNIQHTWNFISQKNELENSLAGLAAYRKISFHSFFLKPKDEISFGFTLASSLEMKFIWDIKNFEEKGIATNSLILDEAGVVIPNMQNIYHFLEATGSKIIYESILENLEKNDTNFDLFKRIVDWLNTKKKDILLPGGIKITKFDFRYLPFNGISVSEIYSPQRYFYNNATNTQKISYYNEQVKAYKPFSYGLFEDREVNIAVVFPSEYEGRTEAFLKTLQKALSEDLHLKHLKYHSIKIDDASLESYKKGIYQSNDILKYCDLAIIIVNEAHEKLLPNNSPYHVTKAKLIGQGIPTQEIQIETIQKRVHPLVLSNISLNIYAKLGGTAWTIEKEEKLKDELVIGIGSTKAANGKNILGIAQIFHPDGRYIVGNCSPLSTFENYSKNLENYLFETLSQIIEAHINTTKSFRLIFHLFKSASEEYELTAIENVIKRFVNYTFDYALLHLGYGHNFRLYADNGKGKLKKGSFVQITPYMALLHFVPTSTLPLKIEIDIRSKGFNDLFYLSKQVFWFSNLSHRSFNPSKRTVTIMYPSLMAGLTEKLSLVEGWNYDMLGYVRDKQWFI